MKKTILLSAFALAAFGAAAQIPNAGFENWSTTSGYANPDNWTTLNPMTTSMSVYTAEKGTPGNPGSSFLKLTSKTVSGIGVVPGIVATGQINAATMSISGGFPYAARPVSLDGSWQYMAMSGADQGFIAVYLTKWDSTAMKRDTVAGANRSLIGMAMSWANFSISLMYYKSVTPDSALIIMSSSNQTPANGSYLWVDNLAFAGAGTTGIPTTENMISNVAVYPNPAKNKVNISCNVRESGNYTVQIMDLSGKTVKTQTVRVSQGDNQLSVDIHALAAGCYTLSLGNGTQQATHKFIVQ